MVREEKIRSVDKYKNNWVTISVNNSIYFLKIFVKNRMNN